MKLMPLFGLVVCASSLVACSKHDCDLEGGDKEKYGEVAEMTGGADHCFVSNGELVATHYEKSIADITSKYETFLKSKSYEVEVKDTQSKRANGESLEGKLVVAKSGGKEVTTLVYFLTEGIVETVTTSK